MKIEYLFSRNEKIGSKLIAWAAQAEKLDLVHTPSHIAVLLNEDLVIESTFTTGIRMIPYSKWMDINEQVARIPYNNLHRSSKEVSFQLTNMWGKKYDWPGIAYFGLCYLGLIIFGKPLPKENKWQKRNRYFCTEFAALLSGCNCSMESPAKMLSEWKK